ncbi:MAG TPA: hypothetical protein VEI97_19175, partial [bacterium]|nr:hypothetical protein [bacterium]
KGTTAPYAYTTNPGTGWSPLVDIVPTPSPSPFAQWTTGSLAVSGPDKLGFLAIQSRPQACSGSTPLPAVPYEVWFVERTGTSWGAPIQVGLADLIVSMTCPGPGSTGNVYGSGITLAGTAGGEWIAVWDSLTTPYNGTNPQPSDSPTKIKWNRTAAGVWAGEADLFTTASYRSPKLARSPNGTVWLVARQGTGGDLAMASHNGTTWTPSPTTVLSPATGSFPYFSVHFDPDGRGILSHSQQVFGSNPSVKLFSQSDSLAAVAGMTTVALESTLSLARYPAVAVPLGDGRYAAAWATAKYGPNTFHSSGTEIDTAVFE